MRLALQQLRIWWRGSHIVGMIFLAYAACIGAVVYLFFFDQSWADCDLVVHDSIGSPDGKLAAVIYEMECGATVGFNTQVSIAPRDRAFSPRENPSFLSLHGQHDLAIKWIEDTGLEVVLPKGETIYRNDSTVGNVTVVYR